MLELFFNNTNEKKYYCGFYSKKNYEKNKIIWYIYVSWNVNNNKNPKKYMKDKKLTL